MNRIRITFPALAVLVPALSLAPACIAEGARTGADTGGLPDGTTPDGTSADTDGADTLLPDTVLPDTVPDDTGGDIAFDSFHDTTPSPDVPPGTCGGDFDCFVVAPPPCHTWTCVNGACEEAPESGASCDDGNACSEGDFCDQGVCAAGTVVDCTALAPDCWTSSGNDVCDPQSGCPGVGAPAGSTCDDGFGLEVGACHNGWLVPYDACDGVGHCLDTSFLVPPGANPLTGTWHTVISTAPVFDTHHTLRAQLAFGSAGVLGASDVFATDTDWRDSFIGRGRAGEGSYCLDLQGRVSFTRDPHVYSGLVDPSRSLIVFGSHDEAALGVALRNAGRPEQVDGRYAIVATAHAPGTTSGLQTWYGEVDLFEGCLVGEGMLTTTSGLGGTLALSGGGAEVCLEPEGALWGFTFALGTGDALTVVHWAGAIGQDGEILLLDQEDVFMRHGTIMLVRVREDVPSATTMSAIWGFVSQRGGASSASAPVTNVTFETGYWQPGFDQRSLSGQVFTGSGERSFIGQWWLTSNGGRYHQRAFIGSEAVHHTGYVSPSANLLIAWVAQPPDATLDEPQLLRLTPWEGSLLVGVRQVAFEDPLFP